MTETFPNARPDAANKGSNSGTNAAAWRAFLLRLHFYVGLFAGPFILIAALTGTLYVATPQLEAWIYREALSTGETGDWTSPETPKPAPLAEQIRAARKLAGDAPIFALRPAPTPADTTRVMFSDPALGPSETRAIFVDPFTLAVKGDMVAYGTSGILPFRTAIDYFHRNLMLGEWGRYYSELAASWLWVATLGGVWLWATGRRRARPVNQLPKAQRLRWIHSMIGVSIAVVLLFLSVTGLTWSQAAGARIDALRGVMGWVTPALDLSLDGAGMADMSGGEHAEHMAQAAAMTALSGPELDDYFDVALASARFEGIDAPMTEIRPPKAGKAWLVTEYDRRWPSQVDAAAVDPAMFTVIARTDFDSFGLVAKLVRWGIDAHMGVLFGLANQIVVALAGLGLVAVIAYGYRIWWLRRPAAGTLPQGLIAGWSRTGATARIATLIAALAFGWALPALGASLALFLAVDLLRSRLAYAAS